MKKTAYIQLVLITAALASCNRPLYQQQAPPYYQQDVPPGDQPDSTNACPLECYDLPPDYYTWYYGFRPYGLSYDGAFYLEGYYNFRYPATIIRSGFGKSSGSVHA